MATDKSIRELMYELNVDLNTAYMAGNARNYEVALEKAESFKKLVNNPTTLAEIDTKLTLIQHKLACFRYDNLLKGKNTSTKIINSEVDLYNFVKNTLSGWKFEAGTNVMAGRLTKLIWWMDSPLRGDDWSAYLDGLNWDQLISGMDAEIMSEVQYLLEKSK